MHAAQGDAMEMRASSQQYTGPSARRIADLVPHEVSFERGWFRTSTTVCHEGDEPDGLAFRQRPDGNGIDVRCHTGGCTRGQVVTALEGVIGLPIWTAYEPVTEAAAPAPLALGHGLETAAANVAALGVAGMLLGGLPGRARRAFRS